MIILKKHHRWLWINRLRWWAIEKLSGYPVSMGPPPYTATDLQHSRYLEKLNALPRQIDWTAVAVQTFQKWLHNQRELPTESSEAAMIRAADDAYINARLAESVRLIFTEYRMRLRRQRGLA